MPIVRGALKPEHAVDLDTGVIVAALIHPADKGDTNTLEATLEAAARNLATVDMAPAPDTPCDLVTDKGYHSREGLKALANGPWKSRISEPLPAKGLCIAAKACRLAIFSDIAKTLRNSATHLRIVRTGEALVAV